MSEITRERITAYMATMPSRQAFLQTVLDSLKHQVDHLYVYCNYPPATDIPNTLYQDWITIQSSSAFGDLGCTGRFHFSEEQEDGYIFLVDDDIIYAHEYVSEMISGIERFDRRAVLSCHGGILPTQVTDFTSQRQLYDFEETIPTDRIVNIVGLGVCGFHSTTLSISAADFPSINRDDLWFAAKCQKEKIPLVVMGRGTKLCSGLYDDFSLWKTENRERAFSLKQTQIAQTVAWKLVLPPIQPGVSILIPIANNELGQLRNTVRSISALSLPTPVELVVIATFTSAPETAIVEEALYSVNDSMEVKLARVGSNRGMSACLRAGLNECKFDLVTMVPVGTTLTPDSISRQQGQILDHPRYCLIECTPDGHAAADSKQTSASVYMIQRHVVQAIDAIPDLDNDWDDTIELLINNLIVNQQPVNTEKVTAKEPPGSCHTETADSANSVFAPFSRSCPTHFIRI